MNEPLRVTGDAFDTVELRIPCKAEWVAVARLAVAAIASRMHFTIEEVEDVKLAVAEACTNVIQHAVDAEHIEIHCESSPEELRLRVRDNGHGTRPEHISSHPPVDDPQVGGLGVFLIRSLMDRVEYNVQPDCGTDILMVKRFQL